MARIVRTEEVLGGEPRIDGTRVGVLDVYELVASGHTPADVADQLDRSLAEVYVALSYYHEYAAQMRDLRSEREDLEADLETEALSPPGTAR